MTREYTDAERMDWLERDCFQLGVADVMPTVESAGNGLVFVGDSLRDAIDRALHFEEHPERFRDTPDDDGGSYL